MLLDLVVNVASKDQTILRRLEEQFNVEAPTGDLIAATQQAIFDTTDFDERETNYNFDYDYQAYETVQRRFKLLVKNDCFSEALELSLELMSQGSLQVESSDEGLMTQDIEDRLHVVVKALKKSDIPAKNPLSWCNKMSRADRAGFICDDDLKELREQIQVFP